MTARLTHRLIALILALALAVMGIAAAMARGQTMAGERVLVLCSGAGLVQETLDAEGRPTGQKHLCPDLALGLLASPGVAAPDVAPPARVLAAELPQPGATLRRASPRAAPLARGPPVPA